jgi:hypothetical protein
MGELALGKMPGADATNAGGPASAGGPAEVASNLAMAESVTRHGPFSIGTNWHFLACGVDSLDVGLFVEWGALWDVLAKQLDVGKERASRSKAVPSSDYEFLILPSGKPPNYRWHLQWPGFHLYLANQKAAQRGTPNAYASINAKTLWLESAELAIQSIVREIELLGGDVKAIKPSRCDLTADFLLPGGLSLPFLLEHRVPEHTKHSHNMTAERLETFYQGAKKSPVQLRIYDKGLEIRKGGIKFWFRDVWGIETLEDVWRVEFQVRRTALKEFKCNTMEDLRKQLAGLWSYLTGHWFSLRLPDDPNATRRTTHPFWQAVQDCAERFGELSHVTRHRENELASEAFYVQHGAGCLAGFAVRRQEPDMEEACRQFTGAMLAYWRERDFAKKYAVKSIQLGFAGSPAMAGAMVEPQTGKDSPCEIGRSS